MNEEELLKYMSFTDDKVMFDKCFYQEVMMPCFSNSITYKNIVKELEKENQQLKEQLQQKENQQLKEQLQQKEDIINKAKEYIENNPLYDIDVYEYSICLNGIDDEQTRKELLEILDNKGE